MDARTPECRRKRADDSTVTGNAEYAAVPTDDAMTVADVRAKWNRRYEARLAEGARPEPNPFALRFAPLMGGDTMLDAACGLGRGIAAAGARYGRIYAVDLSDTAVRAARRLWGANPRIRWLVADVAQVPWPAAFFDLVCALAFTEWPFLRRVPTIVKPGGMFIYEGFSRRQLAVKPDLDPAWTSTPEQMRGLVPDWEVLACEEAEAPPYRVSFAARRPAERET